MNTQTPYTNTHIHMHTRNFTCTHARRHLPAWVHQNIRPNDMTSSQHSTGPCDTSILLLTLIGRIVCVRVCVYTYMHVHVHLHTHIYVYACFHLLKFNLPQTLASRCQGVHESRELSEKYCAAHCGQTMVRRRLGRMESIFPS